MREDMARVIVERPRIKPRNNRIGRRLIIDELPNKEDMRRARAERGVRKQLNENLAPLRRYLEKQVGRPWDKVYSEIAAHLRADNAVQQHMRDHLRDFVAITPRRGIVHWTTTRSGLWRQRLYVDPTSGLLCRTDQLPEEKARRRAKINRCPPPVARIALTSDRELRLINGHWFEVRLAQLPQSVYRYCRKTINLTHTRKSDPLRLMSELIARRLASPPVWDVVKKRMVAVGPAVDDLLNRELCQPSRPDRRYAFAKCPLSTRELRRYGLHNTPDDAVLKRGFTNREKMT